jgi:hypothetical protein
MNEILFNDEFQSAWCHDTLSVEKTLKLLNSLWFSPGTPSSSTTKTGRHDIAEILLKVALNTKKSINQNKSHLRPCCWHFVNWLIDNFDTANIIWMELYIRDWNSTSRYPKFRHIEIWDKRSKLSWKALSLKRNLRKISS